MITMKRIFILSFLFLFLMKSLSAQDIFRAVMSGDLKITRLLLEKHPEWINTTSWWGWTKAKNMVEAINKPARETVSVVSPDGSSREGPPHKKHEYL